MSAIETEAGAAQSDPRRDRSARPSEPAPYVHVRKGLEARIARAVFYQLADLSVPGEGEHAGYARRVERRRVLSPRPSGMSDDSRRPRSVIASSAAASNCCAAACSPSRRSCRSRRERGDYDLNPQNRPTEKIDLKPAAVLLPLVFRHEPHVLLTQRTHHLTRHAGQVAFPGGRADPGDISLVETALRETQEETGIDPAFVTVAGFLDAYETGTGYAILPVVGLLSEGFALSPHAAEVAEIFEVPLSFLLDPANSRTGSRANSRAGCAASIPSPMKAITSGARPRRCC